MRKFFMLPVAILVSLSACKKDTFRQPLPPLMIYKDLQNVEVKYGKVQSIDVDNDAKADFTFGVTLVGDPILQRDRMQFLAHSKIETSLLNNINDESPMLDKLDLISKNHPGYNWYTISAIVLAEKIITNSGNYWDGIWKNSSHKYLPIQVEKNKKIYNGWVEVSFDTSAEKLILHKSALSAEEDKDVKAGI